MTIDLEALMREEEQRLSADTTVAGMSMHPPSGRAKGHTSLSPQQITEGERESASETT